ncbi:hypothetical protein L596_015225 [Steinernema carpocapsae]|uniref:Uncharacterized protein n=1 Tax=Steinernema carpocapsae TaxID=34508 RepID=A0A4U5NF83_STECR|nr:hypothetical protein L596_015225 [Steinernema carpocapsae]
MRIKCKLVMSVVLLEVERAVVKLNQLGFAEFRRHRTFKAHSEECKFLTIFEESFRGNKARLTQIEFGVVPPLGAIPRNDCRVDGQGTLGIT